MRRGRAVSIGLVLLLGVVFLLYGALGSREPAYAHKTLTQWFGYTPQGQTGLYEALRAAGTNAYPVLIRMLRKEDVPGVPALATLLGGHAIGGVWENN